MQIPEFRNESITDWSKSENRTRQDAAIAQLETQFGVEYPNIIDGMHAFSAEKFNTLNPSQPNQIVGVFQNSTADDVVLALKVAADKFEQWRWTSPAERANYLFRAAELMRRRRFELNAALILEVGKSWGEADGDVAEAIDFCEFYGREMLRYANQAPAIQLPGEKDELWSLPLGVGVIIPPWNFPLAILTGMTAASIVTGNTVVLKPASDSPFVGFKFMEIMEEAGLPPGVINLVTGPGSTVGDTLVKHPQTRFVAFTGSKEVGVHIYEEAAKVRPGQIWLKRVIAEMGGKDAIIVDAETDLDEAVEGVALSAFGFQGQKCSACSRAIVDEKVYDEFVEKVVKRTESISVGPAKAFDNFMGPVINKWALEKIQRYIKVGQKEGGRLVVGGTSAPGKGYFLPPTVIADVHPQATIAQEEIFGPVLAVIRANDFDHALEIANGTEFGLTGAVYTNNRNKIETAKLQFQVGNLYVNRKCTGAMVGAHPCGGFNMSGTNSKAGGRDYLSLFMQAKSIAEKIE
ncbi:MAG: L-glutamate gamma-semialdehyde dehydrogenase [Candidatus Poribacteria bacterium]|nr:L-glutamate gamma-semialdehyde dehydrogenase [Candidatus Poribacteria bacterium]